MKQFLQDKKNLVILLLVVLSIIRIPREGIRFVLWMAGGILVAVCCDILINWIFIKKRIIPKSAVITGFIVSGIFNYNEPWFLIVIFSLLAIISKHIVKYKTRHIFNPANFALFVATLFKMPLTWNIESNIYLIVLFGIYFVYSYKKFFHILGFLIFFAGFFAISKINPLGLISWFFLFIMLIEPKTSGCGFLRGFIFGSIAGIFAFLILKYIPAYDAFVSSLFIVNLSNPILEKAFLRK